MQSKFSKEARKRIGDASRKRGAASKALEARRKNKQTTCKVDGCGRSHEGLGYCNMHYLRFKKTGDPGQAEPIIGNGHVSYYGYSFSNGKAEHVSVAEKALGRPLPSGAIVHHVNEDKTDNRNDNLVICPDRAYHNLIHARMRAFEACGNANWMKCPFCKQYDDPKNMYVYPNKRAAKHVECFKEYKNARA